VVRQNEAEWQSMDVQIAGSEDAGEIAQQVGALLEEIMAVTG